VRHPLVRSEDDVVEVRADGDTARVRTTIDASTGCEVLEQRVVTFAPGLSAERGEAGRDEILYVVAGDATLVLDGERHRLAPDTGAYVRGGERWAIENEGPADVKLVAVSAPAESGDVPGRRVTVRFAEQPELRADENRTFRYLVNEDAGCATGTQFVGVVQPCRAPDHSHGYDEVGYIVEGHGLAHIEGASVPLGPGSVFHLPPGQVHCIENVGPEVMRILGVFHPSGDPASRAYDAAVEQEGGAAGGSEEP
jgi:mannose-6-phosphate isomerase-like protein (cupin superfamily)